MNKKIVWLEIDESDLLGGVYGISLVDFPAIQENYIALSDDERNQFALAQEVDQQVLVGPALIPNKLILRRETGTGLPYYVAFTKDLVKRSAHAVMKKGILHNFTEMHQSKVDDVYMLESWIIEDENLDKSKKYGFNLPKGTWMVMVKVMNKDLWKRIKSKELKGFSIEAFYATKLSQTQKSANDVLIDVIKENVLENE